MKITHYLYNTFVIESGEKKIAIDPGALFFYFFRFTTLIPKDQWADITHILLTHGDPDHYWHADRVADASDAPVICHQTMVREINGRKLMLGPRARGVAFTTPFNTLHPLMVGEAINVDGITITGIKTTHGELQLKFGPFTKNFKPGPEERIGWGAIGFSIQLDGMTLVNLGDTMLHTEEWKAIQKPDVLMIPIGGRIAHNTMDEQEALEAVRIMHPKLVIPCHYNCPGLFTRRLNPADDMMFQREVKKTGAECTVLHDGESIAV